MKRVLQKKPLKTIHQKAKNIPVRQACPSLVTMSALAFGVSSMHYAYWMNWKMALICILLSAFFDGLDGRVARMLKTESKFGAELDSLSDFVSFGVAPGFLLYQWTMEPTLKKIAFLQEVKDPTAIGMPWFCALLLAMCCAFRLARFNTMLDVKQKPYWKHFFMGLPAPGGAGLALFPLILWFAFGWEFVRNPILVSVFVVGCALLMASRIPTICLKKMHIPEKWRYFSTVVFMIIIGLMVSNFWIFLSVIGFLYLISLPVGVYYFLKFKRNES